jgi:hypothetical protein
MPMATLRSWPVHSWTLAHGLSSTFVTGFRFRGGSAPNGGRSERYWCERAPVGAIPIAYMQGRSIAAGVGVRARRIMGNNHGEKALAIRLDSRLDARAAEDSRDYGRL